MYRRATEIAETPAQGSHAAGSGSPGSGSPAADSERFR